MKALPVDIRALADAFDRGPNESVDFHLDLETGELLELWTGDTDAFEEDALADRAVLFERLHAQPERFPDVPFLQTREQFELMERFALSQTDEEDREQLLRSLKGKGAFGRFKDTLARFRKRDDWFAFHTAQLEIRAREWLRELAIEAPPRRVEAPPVVVPPPPPRHPTLVDLLIFGGTPELREGLVIRTLEAPSPQQAQAWFKALARSICAHLGEEWRKRFVENTDHFERERFTLQVEGNRVELTVAIEPEVFKLFSPK